MTDCTPPARLPLFAALLVVAAASTGGCRSAGAAPDGWVASTAGRVTAGAAVVIAGAEVESRVTPGGQVWVRPTGPHARATATALTADGYYLTAAHCVEREPVHLLVPAGNGFAFKRAAVVWSSRAAGYQEDWADLALIHVDAEASGSSSAAAAFTWAPARSLAPESAVAATRLRLGGPAATRTGRVVDATGTRPGGVRLTCVIHDVPLDPGYSGGPLFDRDGALIGINVRTSRVLLESGEWLPVGLAVRPDAAAVDRLVREHRERRAARGGPATRPAG